MKKVGIIVTMILIIGVIIMVLYEEKEKIEDIQFPSIELIIANQIEDDDYLWIQQSLVSVQQGEMKGKGIIWRQEEEYLVIVSVGHIIKNNQNEVYITLFDGEEVIGWCSEKESEQDLVYITIDLEQFIGKNWRNYATLYSEKLLEINNEEVIWYINQTNAICELVIKDVEIYLNDFEAIMIRAIGDVEKGMSGNGVFTINGELVGIICGSSEFLEVAILPTSTIMSEDSDIE